MREPVSGQDDPMFSPKTKSTLFILSFAVASMLAAETFAQSGTSSAQYQARLAAMRQAQARGQAQVQVEAQPVHVATAAPQQHVPQQIITQTVVPARTASHAYQPAHTRTAQLITEGSIIDGGAPILGETVLSQPVISEQIVGGQVLGQPVVTGPVWGQPVVTGPISSEIVYGNEVVSSGCSTCGDSGSYFAGDCHNCGACAGNVPCWLGPLGRALRTGSYSFGTTAFRHPAFANPTGSGELVEDSNFGVYGGFNLGIPLNRLFGGRISGQFGLRSVQTNFGSNAFSDSNRDQLFVTAGVYRRVDYGLQLGLVIDVLAEEFYTEADVAQLRGEVSWAYPSGSSIGFRFTSGQEDDTSSGVFAGTPFEDLTTTTDDHYRFFLRKIVPTGGWEEIFVGWTTEEQFQIGADFNIPLQSYVALEAGAVLYLSELEDATGGLGGTRIDDSFNLYVGFAFRPQGRAYYQSYDRPLLPVADNGTLLLRRQ